MRFATRTFLWSFVPFALLLGGSFWAIQDMVQSRVREQLRASLRENQMAVSRIRARSELQNSRFLRMVGENAALKAGMQLLLANGDQADARLTVEDQLREIANTLQFDLLMVSDPAGAPLAGVIREGQELAPASLAGLKAPQRGLVTIKDLAYQVASTPIDQGDENLGTLAVGERFDFAEFTTPTVLSHNGTVLKASISGASLKQLESALKLCGDQRECEFQVGDDTFLSLPLESMYFGNGYMVRSLQSINSATRPVQIILRRVFLLTGLGALLGAVVLAAFSSRSILRPLAAVVEHLRESETTGLLPEFRTDFSSVQEARELTESFNRAAAAIREARQNLYRAYVEFVGSLASALDARDRYTAGHSQRVSEYSCAIAASLKVEEDQFERVRIGALLHDIGKIGIPDTVLQKPGRLTKEEFELIQQHPGIGRKILEGVNGFRPYLAAVELHHENWDGSGYPHGLAAEAVPLEARIIHVSDAYDAMTSDRPYRLGMGHERAVAILRANAGTQFDPVIVDVFTQVWTSGLRRTGPGALDVLAEAVRGELTPVEENTL